MKELTNNNKKSSLLLILIVLTGLAIGLQIAHVAGQFGSLFHRGNKSVGDFVLNLISTHQLPLLPMLQFIAAEFILYSVAISFIYLATKTIGSLFKLKDNHTYLLGIFLWLIGAIFVATANSYYFPHSTFSLGHIIITKIGLVISTILLIIITLITIYGVITNIIKKRKWLLGAGLTALALGFSWFFYSYYHPTPNTYAGSAKHPNIIIIGLDSIRPDHIGYYGNKINKTPNIDKFLGSSTNFTHTYSAMARTYVAWNSILTGKYPKHDKVRDNLIDPTTLNLSDTLVTTLKQASYATIFATDNRQFSLINKQFDFDKIISPKMGIYDFMLCEFNDFPLSNLIMNSPIGAYLFPYNYANRMSYVTYEPKTFDQMLNRQLAHRPNKPLFLGMHVILTHWPYMWAKDHQSPDLLLPDKFNNMLNTIDQQFGDMLQILQKNNLLKHSVVVLLSDHGVSLGLPGDRVIATQNYVGDKNKTNQLTQYEYTKKPKSGNKLGLDTCSGEGTDILSFNTSNHIILGFKTYGLPYGMVKDTNYRVSLIDIAPTIIDLLHLPPLHKIDGISLKSFMIGNVKWQNQPRAMFFETGIWMPLFSVNDLKKGLDDKYIAQKLNTLYSYNSKNDYIIIKNSAMHNLISNKQRGILYGDWYLAHYPKSSSIDSKIISANNKTEHCDFKQTDDQNHSKMVCYIFTNDPNPYYVLVNTKSGKWTMDFNSTFAKTAPLDILMQKFKAFYGTELD